MALLGEENSNEQSVFYRAFVRDNGRCIYCSLDILKSFDAFAASHLDHLKPRSAGGADDDIWNRVISCGVCNSLKGSFDPCEGASTTSTSFDSCVQKSREFIFSKRTGERDNSYWRDYQY